MAGKTKQNGSTPRSNTPRAADLPCKGQLGQMGLKSSPYAPTDCKLVNQYMILDRMHAHYKKLNSTIAAVDTSTPKAWLVSQKMRDAARREAMGSSPRESADRRSERRGFRSSRQGSVNGSEGDREEMMAMMESFSQMDDLDGYRRKGANTSMEIHHSDSSGMNYIDRNDINGSYHSPNKSRTGKSYRTNIHDDRGTMNLSKTRIVAERPLYKTQRLETYQASAPINYTKNIPSTPRSGDVLEKNASKFTEEKPFQPRTLKTDRKSKLTEFKDYTPPKRKTAIAQSQIDEESEISSERNDISTAPVPTVNVAANKSSSLRASLRSRPGTANTLNSTDWMSESIVSRDHSERPSPQDVPALNISIDQDHFKWIKEQQTKAQLRQSGRSPHSTLGLTRVTADLNGTRTMNGALGRTSNAQATMRGQDDFYPNDTTRLIIDEEEELKYLQFIQDVTNDVLDRGIFTNRVLKVVFDSHVERRRHDLQVSRMRNMLEDLRIDLGIPVNDEEDTNDGLGLISTWKPQYSPRSPHGSTGSAASTPRANRRSRQDTSKLEGTMRVSTLPTLQNSAAHPQPAKRGGGRIPSPEGKPPIPRLSRGSRGAQSPSPSRSIDKSVSSKESIFDTVTEVGTTAADCELAPSTADILTINHDEAPAKDDTENNEALQTTASMNHDLMTSTMKTEASSQGDGYSEDEDIEADQAAAYEQHLAQEDDQESLSPSELSEADILSHRDMKNMIETKSEIVDTTSVKDLAAHNEEDLVKSSKPTPRERRRRANEPTESARSHNTTTDTLNVSELSDDDYSF